MQRHCLVFKCGASDENNLAPDRLCGTSNTLGSALQRLSEKKSVAYKATYALVCLFSQNIKRRKYASK